MMMTFIFEIIMMIIKMVKIIVKMIMMTIIVKIILMTTIIKIIMMTIIIKMILKIAKKPAARANHWGLGVEDGEGVQ